MVQDVLLDVLHVQVDVVQDALVDAVPHVRTLVEETALAVVREDALDVITHAQDLVGPLAVEDVLETVILHVEAHVLLVEIPVLIVVLVHVKEPLDVETVTMTVVNLHAGIMELATMALDHADANKEKYTNILCHQ